MSKERNLFGIFMSVFMVAVFGGMIGLVIVGFKPNPELERQQQIQKAQFGVWCTNHDGFFRQVGAYSLECDLPTGQKFYQ